MDQRFESSRRNFLKGMGVAAGAVTLLPAASQAAENTGEAADPDLVELGRRAREIVLRVNGTDRKLTVEPRTTLLDALRVHLDMTGSKLVCDRGSCGACTVLLDGLSVTSCMVLAMDAEGHEIVTIEGIAADPRYKPLIDSFCEHDAAQCGFCIPGVVVRTAAWMNGNPAADGEGIREGLAGNICRCGTYPKIFEAVESCIKDGGLA